MTRYKRIHAKTQRGLRIKAGIFELLGYEVYGGAFSYDLNSNWTILLVK